MATDEKKTTKSSGKVVEYVGAGREVTRRELTPSDFAKGGHSDVKKQTWDSTNGWKVPVEDLGGAKVAEWLDGMPDFKIADAEPADSPA